MQYPLQAPEAMSLKWMDAKNTLQAEMDKNALKRRQGMPSPELLQPEHQIPMVLNLISPAKRDLPPQLDALNVIMIKF